MSIPNFIESYNLFDKDFCAYAIKCFEEANKHNLCLNRQQSDNVHKTLKDDSLVHFPYYDFPMAHLSFSLIHQFEAQFTIAQQQYYDKYSQLHDLGALRYYAAKIQKTEPGQGYHTWHCEADNRELQSRVLVWTVYLNDDFEAGETEFLYQQYRYKPKMGDIVIFPAAFTHTHRGNPPIGGTKYIITGWLEF